MKTGLITIETLRRVSPPIDYRMSDKEILRALLIQAGEYEKSPTFKPRNFEKHTGVEPLPQRPLSNQSILRTLDYESLKIRPRGKNIQEQVRSLLPKTPIFEELLKFLKDKEKFWKSILRGRPNWVRLRKAIGTDRWPKTKIAKKLEQLLMHEERIRDSLAYVLSRIVTHTLPEELWTTNQVKGLDELTHGLFKIHIIARIGDETVPWLDALHKLVSNPAPITNWSSLTLGSDGVQAGEWGRFLDRIKARIIKIVKSKKIIELCTKLNKQEKPSRLSSTDVRNAIGHETKWTAHSIKLVEIAITERIVVNMPALGLRYRYILTPLRRSEFWPTGMTEKIYLADKEYSGVTVVVEPATSQGPLSDDLPEDSVDVIVDSETISFRLDMFDRDMSSVHGIGQWNMLPYLEPLQKITRSPDDVPFWIYHVCNGSTKSQYFPKQRAIDVFSIASANRGPPKERRHLMKLFGIPESSARKILSEGVRRDALSILYHPTLDYAALPQGVLVVVKDTSPDTIETVQRWLTWSAPYCHILTGNDGRDLIARARVALYSGPVWAGAVKYGLEQLSVEHYVSRVDRSFSYYLASLHQIYDGKQLVWKDPWM